MRGQRFRDSLAAAFGRRVAGIAAVTGVFLLVGLVARAVGA